MVAASSSTNRAFWERYCPLGPVAATSAQVASVVLYLASPGSGFVNGAVIPVDGGLSWIP
jgi:NAD(P)-dependent dehydrogenase (short-subunit alcohol dehydrogenase family)